MTAINYGAFFEMVTGYRPYPYQVAVAEGQWPALVDVPTGLGKTAAVVVAWLWRRLVGQAECGRRLVYCLPMRVLVEQTFDNARRFCKQAKPLFEERAMPAPSVYQLMGGQPAMDQEGEDWPDKDKDWDEKPEEAAILVGTQDMLLSRALNRGYGMSRYRWPVHFGLLHCDAWWVFDETQLMGVGVETSAQLEGLRGKLGTLAPVRSLWMSATLGNDQLTTVDHSKPGDDRRLQLTAADHDHAAVRQRTTARKVLSRALSTNNTPLVWDGKDESRYAKELGAQAAIAHEQRGGLTLVIVNQVARAQAVYKAVVNKLGADAVGLIHSRFRADERKKQQELLLGKGNRVVVATQAVEAGVDVSAHTLFTELAPWPSLVQRWGRCNRYGELDDARILWIDVQSQTQGDKKVAAPYEAKELEVARELIAQLAAAGGEAGPAALTAVQYQPPPFPRPVVRRRDVLDLFDTTPDVRGNDVDVSMYVRDGEDVDCQLYWRALGDKGPAADEAPPQPRELCRVRIGPANDFLDKLVKKGAGKLVWLWDPLKEAWTPPSRLRPGQVILVDSRAGGYDPKLGWTGEVMPREPVPEVERHEVTRKELAGIAWLGESLSGDPDSKISRWVPLTEHLAHVRDEAYALAKALGLSEEADTAKWLQAVTEAGRWHDVGKAHEEFQKLLLDTAGSAPPEGVSELWAKSERRRAAGHGLAETAGEIAAEATAGRAAKPVDGAAAGAAQEANQDVAGEGAAGAGEDKDAAGPKRRYFRHELASALAYLATGARHEDPGFASLVAYLIAAHHGKVRVSIRSIPGETVPRDERLYARGVWQDDELPALVLPRREASLQPGTEPATGPGSEALGPVRLDLSCMQLGPESWLSRVLSLRDDEALGPFRLAMLELIVRVADWRASNKEARGDYKA